MYGFVAVVVIGAVAVITILSIGIPMNVQAQNTTTTAQPQTADTTQIKNYLTGTIQALDSGNNTMALEQLELAEDQLTAMTGTVTNDDNGEGEDENEGVEEGPE
jgi:hypothetical protein